MIAKGRAERYRHPSLRSTWWVKSSTDKFVTMQSDNPTFKAHKIPADQFPIDRGKEWEKI